MSDELALREQVARILGLHWRGWFSFCGRVSTAPPTLTEMLEPMLEALPLPWELSPLYESGYLVPGFYECECNGIHAGTTPSEAVARALVAVKGETDG